MSPATARHADHNPQRRFRIESVALLLLASLFVYLSHVYDWFEPVDRLIYDAIITNTHAPVDPDLVIVAIDDATLHRYGAWPWVRSLHARLLGNLNTYRPDTVIIDIVFDGETPHDEPLVAAAKMTDKLALPVIVEQLSQGGQHVEVLPFPALSGAADHLGHVHVELDEDAIVRGTYLYQGVGRAHWPHLMKVVADANATGGPGDAASECRELTASQLYIHKCEYVRLPFAGPSTTYPQVSAQLLLAPDPQRDLLERALRSKTVLVGVTAKGIGDWVSSPTSGDTGPMPGVEFNANLLSALRLDTVITHLGSGWVLAIALLIVAICTQLLPRLRSKQMVFATAALIAAPLLITAAALLATRSYIPLANASIIAALIYPVWSWRRHEIAWGFIQTELDRIDAEHRGWDALMGWQRGNDEGALARSELAELLKGSITVDDEGARLLREEPMSTAEQALFAAALPVLLDQPPPEHGHPGEVLAAQIDRLNERAREVREGRALGLAGLERMANAALILSATGKMVFANAAATRMLSLDQADAQMSLTDVFSQIQPPLGYSWVDLMRDVILTKTPRAFEGFDANQAPVYVTAEPLTSEMALELSPEPDQQGKWEVGELYAPYWVLTISDLTTIREAEAQREEALAFLSHDIRSPLTSIIALIESQKSTPPWVDAIHQYAHKGLATSEQFLQLSRLQLQSSFETYELDLEQVLHNAVEQVFFLAREAGIAIATDAGTLDDEGAWIVGNGELLERALVNLLSNAVKYSEPDTTVRASLVTLDHTHRIQIADEGFGIPADELDLIFEPYFRSSAPQLAKQRGAGLGLRFVKTVVDRHHGDLSVTSDWGKGTTFTVTLSSAEPLHRQEASTTAST